MVPTPGTLPVPASSGRDPTNRSMLPLEVEYPLNTGAGMSNDTACLKLTTRAKKMLDLLDTSTEGRFQGWFRSSQSGSTRRAGGGRELC